MGESLGSALLELRTTDKGLTVGIGKAKGAANKLEKSFSNVSAAIITMNQGLALIGRAIRGVGRAFEIAVAPAADFEKSMKTVQALTQSTGDAFEKLEEQAKTLGETTKFTAIEAADGMAFLAQAGFDTTQILGAMPDVLNLAAAANLDLATTADIASNVMSGFGLEAGEMGMAADVLTKSFISANTNLSQLGEAMKFAGPVAKAMGISFEETTAFLSLLGNAGIQASLAGTSLRGALIRLASPTNEAKEIFEKLGVNVKDSSGELLSITTIIQKLEDAGATATEAMDLFGLRAGPAMLAAIAQGSTALTDFTAKLKDAGGTAKEIADKQMEGLSGALVELKSAWTGFTISVNDELGTLGLLEDAVDSVTRSIRTLQRDLLRVQVNWLEFELTGARIGEVFKNIFALVPAPDERVLSLEKALVKAVAKLNDLEEATIRALGPPRAAEAKTFGEEVGKAGEKIAGTAEEASGAFKGWNEQLSAAKGFFGGWIPQLSIVDEHLKSIGQTMEGPFANFAARGYFGPWVPQVSIIADKMDEIVTVETLSFFDTLADDVDTVAENFIKLVGVMERAAKLIKELPKDLKFGPGGVVGSTLAGRPVGTFPAGAPGVDLGQTFAGIGVKGAGQIAGVSGAIAGFQAGGPIGAAVGFVAELVLSNEDVQKALGALSAVLMELIAPIAEAIAPALLELVPVLKELKPLFEIIGIALSVSLAPMVEALRAIHGPLVTLSDGVDFLAKQIRRLRRKLGQATGGLFAEGGRPPVGALSIVGEKGPEGFLPDVPGTIIPNNALRDIMSRTHAAGPAREINISLAGSDSAQFSKKQIRRLVEAINFELDDDASTLAIQVIR